MATQSDPQAPPSVTPTGSARNVPKAPAARTKRARDMTVDQAVRLLTLPFKHPGILPEHRAVWVEKVMRGATKETILKALKKLGADEVVRLPKTKYTRRVLERIEQQAAPEGYRAPKSRKASKQPKALPRACKQQKEAP